MPIFDSSLDHHLSVGIPEFVGPTISSASHATVVTCWISDQRQVIQETLVKKSKISVEKGESPAILLKAG
jgi:hypothetical protein